MRVFLSCSAKIQYLSKALGHEPADSKNFVKWKGKATLFI